MKSDVRALVIFDMNGDFRARLEAPSRRQFIALHVGPHNVVGFARRYPLREFAGVIGIEFPTNSLFVRAPDLDLHAVERMAIRIPHRAKDQSVGLRLLGAVGAGSHWGEHAHEQQRRYCGGDMLTTNPMLSNPVLSPF